MRELSTQELNALAKYVSQHTTRGDCQCGRCIDGGKGSAEKPTGHTLDLTLFKVGLRNKPTAEGFRQVAAPIMPGEKEVSYLELGAVLGDQGFALITMALGHLLGVWECLCPETVLGDTVDQELKMRAAQSGYITIHSKTIH